MKVKVKHTFELIHDLPGELCLSDENSTAKQKIEFLLNQSSYCADNVLGDLEDFRIKYGCVCSIHSAEFVGIVE